MSFLESIKNSSDVKKIPADRLPALAEEIRERIIATTAENGGHIGPNLGVVELCIAMHRVFNTPEDNFIFDVSHQSYVHKLLTGRNGPEFDKMRQGGGLCGFCNRQESPDDSFGAGHAGTALSAALGMAAARDLRGSKEHVVAVVGDAALTCGVTMEALNNIASSTKRLILILNDNKWAIDKNVGAISDYLNQLITTPGYNKANNDVTNFLGRVPGGKKVLSLAQLVKRDTKDFISQKSSLFEKFQLRYIGPVDGHNIEQLVHYLEFCKNYDGPIVLHVRTEKGKGSELALSNPEKYHGCAPFLVGSGAPKTAPSPNAPANWQDVFGSALVRYAKKDPRIIGITAAMPSGTSLNMMKKELPAQYFDVGIAEEHAVVFAAGMATKGFKPVCAIYSTFIQRSYDMIIHDVCLQNLNVTFCMDRAGLSPNDGATHHGLFDVSFLRCVPGAVIMQPKDEDELADMLYSAVEFDGPAFVRYPRGAAIGVPIKETPAKLEFGKAEVLKPGNEIEIWAFGTMTADARVLAERLEKEFPGASVGIVNARFAKPLDVALLEEHARRAKLIVSMEDNVVAGGFGAGIVEELQAKNILTPVERIGWPDVFVEHGSSVGELRAKYDLSPDAIFARVAGRFRG